ncbi:MAG TPA: hypothetical protein VMU59_05905 [Caulobacteraceae bacterium]|nr:hypothetical protein [Caulobacteraceae bacterium]
MPAKQPRPSLEDAHKATTEAAAETGRAINDLAKRAGAAVQDRFDTIGVDPRQYADYASEKLDTAQEYLVTKIKEKPVQAALTALGVGFVLGFLLAR